MSKNVARFLAVALLTAAVAGVLLSRSVSASEKAVSIPDPAVDEPLAQTSGQESVVLAGGCFWGVQAVFQHVKGVISATSG
jgi:peptide-methionine (S)-S-oxide reductase